MYLNINLASVFIFCFQDSAFNLVHVNTTDFKLKIARIFLKALAK